MRLYQAVELCGGLIDEADGTRVNLAMQLKDGGAGSSNLIDINKASKSELMQLSGIGEARALDIISYREKHGAFKRIEDIKNVSGIKDAAFNKIKDYICV